MEMTTHELKTTNPYFHEVWCGWKNFEIRKDDRGFKAGDLLILQEYNTETESYTGRSIICSVDYIIARDTFVGLQDSYCAMGIEVLQRRP